MRRLIRELLTTSAANTPPSPVYVEATTQVAHAGMALALCLPLANLLGAWYATGIVLAGWAVWEAVQIVRRPDGLKFWKAWRDSRDDKLAYAAGCGLALAQAGVWPWWAAGLTAAGVVLFAAWQRRRA